MSRLRRKRGVILTPEGLQKIQQARLESEDRENFGERYTLERLSERTSLDLHTIKKIFAGNQGIDKRSIERLFIAFNLDLQENWCCTSSNPNKRQDWGEAMRASLFYGRTKELAELEKWLVQDRCRVITILGMGGVGKTSLSVKLAQQIQKHCDYLIWRSLQDAPSLEEILTALIEFLSDEPDVEADIPKSTSEKISRLLDCLRSSRCLLILDNAESLLRGGSRAGLYREGYERYGELFKRIGESDHQSCLLLTTREKPREIARMEGEILPVRTWKLKGLKEGEGQEILKVKGVFGTESEFNTLVARYAGNALALNIVATTIQELFEGNLSEFLRQDAAVFGDIRDLLDQHFNRLSSLEKEILYWLAINREPVSVSQLREDMVFLVPPQKLLEELESLSRRALIEKNIAGFSLQPVVTEYLTSRLVEQVCEEIISHKLKLFRSHALMKAQAKDYVKETQIRLILQPIIDGLFATLKNKRSIENQLTQILTMLRETSPLEPGYVGGNIINLLNRLGVDLTGYNFAELTIWQADLRNACLHEVNFQNADLAKSVFAETFGGIMSVAFSPDGKILAIGDTSGTIRLYRVTDFQQLLTCQGHTSWVVSLAFSPDGTTLASGSSDCTVRLWNASTGQSLHILREHAHEVWSVSFSRDGQTLASGSDDCTARLWRVATGKCIRVFSGHTNQILSVVFSRDGRTLISGSHDCTIKLWEVSTGRCLRTLQGHYKEIRSLAVSPDGQTIASSSNDQTIRLWNFSTGECFKVLQGHSDGVWSVSFSSQGDILASGSIDQTVRLWRVDTGECFKVLQGHSNWVLSVAFSSQGDILASGSRDQTMKLWNIRTGQCFKTFQGHINQILSVAFCRDGQMLASGGPDQKVRLWESNTGRVLRIFHGHTNWIYSVAFSPQGNVLVSGSGDKTIKLWDVHTGRILKTFQGHRAAVRSATLSPDGQILASSSDDKIIRLWDVSNGQTLKILQGHHGAVWSIAFSFDGQMLASGSLDQTIKIWDVSTGECLRTLEGHETWVWSVALSPNNKILASTSGDETLRLWDINTGECVRILKEDKNIGTLFSLAFSTDSRTIASSGHSHKIELWNIDTGERFKTLQGHTASIHSVAFSPDNKTLVSGSEDETIRLWDVRTGECLKTLTVEKPYESMNITGILGLNEATIATLKALGAVW
jgi:WD40 repeat protein